MQLIHYSAKPIKAVKSVRQPAEPDRKPKGLWLSVEDGEGWKEWCEAEGFGLKRLAIATEITLADDSQILRLSCCADIDAFTREYLKRPEWGGTVSMYIDWHRVAQQYQGIIIAPYQRERRLYDGCSWYYGWDCSSGCVWDREAVACVRVLESVN